ncbi:HAD-IA family hydrolase [Acinetobacter pollinis]|jgi:phosphoglycolate phosphatase|uniref:HAD-IA family hydrolase n=1 Tax=Acinetobacter pollinis TaxID=2605270 RepID=UPI0018A2BB32|nr:HAD-IA family hydrolase [Acinetobacter pollinis]MBF7689749.1 HAD-IA family hydrolase [Acinetobacter pollinis]MBF7692253.1 HAD-IA family hydrolase [Acinetobacter pollinis]MBF7697139.1 HAD-IA family hydrolase [Acinetobacter pollinis]MBF7700190.1 HAD-IA family hydrolase [Acinetobacter pollinis]
MEKAKLVVFDWDGTLFNSIGQIVDSLLYAARKYHQPLTADEGKDIIGLGLPEVMQRLFPTVPELHEDILNAYAEHYVLSSESDSWFEGVSEMLTALQLKGVILAVATGKSRRGLDRVLLKTGSNDLFEITRAASETKSKPNPLMLQEILEHTQIPVHEAIMVGDTSYDLEMASNIKMPSIGVTYGVHSEDILMNYNPLCVVNSIDELTEKLLAYT